MEEKQAATAALTGQRQEAERTHLARGQRRRAASRAASAGCAGRSPASRSSATARRRGSASSPANSSSSRSPSRNSPTGCATRRPNSSAPSPTLEHAHRAARRRRSAAPRSAGRRSPGLDRELRDAQRALAEKESKLEVLRAAQRGRRRLLRRHAGGAARARQSGFLQAGDRWARWRNSSRSRRSSSPPWKPRSAPICRRS